MVERDKFWEGRLGRSIDWASYLLLVKSGFMPEDGSDRYYGYSGESEGLADERIRGVSPVTTIAVENQGKAESG